MEGIGHYENILAGIYEKIKAHEPLSLDDKIDYYLAVNRISLKKFKVEKDNNLREYYRKEAKTSLEKAKKLEKRLGINCQPHSLPQSPEDLV